MAKRRTIGNIIAPPRFLAFVVVLAAGVATTLDFTHDLVLSTMIGFDVAAVLFLLLSVPLLRTSEGEIIRDHAYANDANRAFLLGVTAVVMLVLLFAIAAETMGHRPQPFTKVLIIVTLALAWLFSNTVYALHYAHLAYRQPIVGCEGIDFPGTEAPVYWDFVYFAFTLGMTFQTSDVAIRAPAIRRVVTLHSLAAFVFNIGVLAFTINVLGSD